MDAISFVVGLQSKDLRGKLLTDLIFKTSADDTTGARLKLGATARTRAHPHAQRTLADNGCWVGSLCHHCLLSDCMSVALLPVEAPPFDRYTSLRRADCVGDTGL